MSNGFGQVDYSKLKELSDFFQNALTERQKTQELQYQKAREDTERIQLQNIMETFQKGIASRPQQVQIPGALPTGGEGGVAFGRPPAATTETRMVPPGLEERRQGELNALAQMLATQTGTGLNAAAIFQRGMTQGQPTPFGVYATGGQEDREMVSKFLELSRRAQQGERFTITQHPGGDGYWYDVIENRETGETAWRLSRNENGRPVPVQARAGRAEHARLLRVEPEEGREIEIYGYTDAAGNEVVTKRQPRSGVPVKITRTVNWVKQNGLFTVEPFTGTPREVIRRMRAKQNTIDEAIKKSGKAEASGREWGLLEGNIESWADFKEGKVKVDDIHPDIQHNALNYEQLESEIKQMEALYPEDDTSTDEIGDSQRRARAREVLKSAGLDTSDQSVDVFLKNNRTFK